MFNSLIPTCHVYGSTGDLSGKATHRRVEGSRSTVSSETGILECDVAGVLALHVALGGKMEEKASRFGSVQAWRRGTVSWLRLSGSQHTCRHQECW